MIKASIHQESIHQSTLLYLLLHLSPSHLFYGLPGGSDGKESVGNVGDPSLIPVSEDPLEKELETHSNSLA